MGCPPSRWACLPHKCHAKIQVYCGPGYPIYMEIVKIILPTVFIDSVLISCFLPVLNCSHACIMYYTSTCPKLWSYKTKTLRPSGPRAEALAIFFWPKGPFYFKIVRWIGALGTPHTLIALRSVIARFLAVVSRQPPSGAGSFFLTLPFGQTTLPYGQACS